MKPLLRLLPVLALLFSPSLLAQEAETAPSEPRPQDDPPVWAGTFDEAVERARAMKEGRILVELRDAQCPECERMEKLLYPSASFNAFTRDKVPVSVLRGTQDGQTLAARFRIRQVPAWLVVTPDLLLSGKQEGESNQSTWIDRFVASERSWGEFLQLLEAEKKSPSDPAAALAVGEEGFRRFGDAMAEERFRRVADDRKAPAELREKALSYLATIALEARRLDEAEKILKQLAAKSKDPALREKAELRLADVEVGRDERKKAADRLKAFLAKYPESPLRPQAEALLNALGASNP
jgi:thioredoxin-like negative regulator of GroEL